MWSYMTVDTAPKMGERALDMSLCTLGFSVAIGNQR